MFRVAVAAEASIGCHHILATLFVVLLFLFMDILVIFFCFVSLTAKTVIQISIVKPVFKRDNFFYILYTTSSMQKWPTLLICLEKIYFIMRLFVCCRAAYSAHWGVRGTIRVYMCVWYIRISMIPMYDLLVWYAHKDFHFQYSLFRTFVQINWYTYILIYLCTFLDSSVRRSKLAFLSLYDTSLLYSFLQIRFVYLLRLLAVRLGLVTLIAVSVAVALTPTSTSTL